MKLYYELSDEVIQEELLKGNKVKKEQNIDLNVDKLTLRQSAAIARSCFLERGNYRLYYESDNLNVMDYLEKRLKEDEEYWKKKNKNKHY